MNKLWLIFLLPREVYANMKDGKCSFVAPFLVLFALAVVFGPLQISFISDEIWQEYFEQSGEFNAQIIERILGAEASDSLVSEEEIIQQANEFAKTITFWLAPIDMLFGLFIVVLLFATYFFLAAKVLNVEIAWRQWWGFVFWGSLVTGLGWIGFTVATMMTGVFEPIAYFSPFVWFGLKGGFFAAVTVFVIWQVFIFTQGFRAWTEKPMVICLIVVLIPVICGVLINGLSLNLSGI